MPDIAGDLGGRRRPGSNFVSTRDCDSESRAESASNNG